MCDPVSIAAASLAVATIGTAATVVGQQQQASAQHKYQKAAVEQGDKIAHQDFINRISSTQTRLTQEEEAASQKIGMNNVEAAKAISTSRVAAGEAGVQGNSVDALFADFHAQQANFNQSINNNVAGGRGQYRNDVLGIQSQGENALASLRFAPVSGPNYLAAGANLAAAGLNTYDRYQIRQEANANREPQVY